MHAIVFVVLFVALSIWALAAYVNYGYHYRLRYHLPNPTRWSVLAQSGAEMWSLIFAPQTDPVLERLHRRVILRYVLLPVILIAVMVSLIFR